ncbi:hypothetical protein FRACYDRAFT_267867 [Fragilariopsis cylindrus CCMP1102]|uniref:Uncharacterized protein n=1 Tax=Fragilariopsis cylindrus CCMP1102 TaxID=635003 RepID=A0A1E7FSN2_9STRA|nr:hypothetical protein FRACYDRAFT_267867 [Fragilariopsis cylindrus CCMP1102]|eukprot:OEU21117.1 hypothetical protein FRACYDRAFT_267867 [Fragilariopsis cylindrus CCMP1102]
MTTRIFRVLISKTIVSPQHRNIIFRDETIGLLRHNTWNNRPTTNIVLNRGIVGDSSTITTSSSDDDNSSVDDNEDSSSSPSSASSSPKKIPHWRKQQLTKIENKFNNTEDTPLTIENEEDLQPMWKEMEGRVTKRKSRTLEDTKGKTERMNIKKTEEEAWLQQGVYESYNNNNNNDEEVDTDDDSKINK